MRRGGQVLNYGTASQYRVILESHQDADGRHWTHECGTQLLSYRVTQPIWYDGMGTTGGGEVRDVVIPYCPQCETFDRLGAPEDIVPRARYTFDEIVAEIVAERARQDAQWGGRIHDHVHDGNDWIALICKHAGAGAFSQEDGDRDTYVRSLIRAGALAIAALEALE